MDVALLRASFELVIERQPALTHRFYQILFERYPSLKSLFGRTASEVQERMLARALASVLEHLEDAAWLSGTLGALGARHVGYGVTDEMYDQVGECLLATLAEIAGDDWTPALATAWAEAYGAIAGLMKEGARSAADAAA
jgi:hemoglobin-like flavoprotein